MSQILLVACLTVVAGLPVWLDWDLHHHDDREAR